MLGEAGHIRIGTAPTGVDDRVVMGPSGRVTKYFIGFRYVNEALMGIGELADIGVIHFGLLLKCLLYALSPLVCWYA